MCHTYISLSHCIFVKREKKTFLLQAEEPSEAAPEEEAAEE